MPNMMNEPPRLIFLISQPRTAPSERYIAFKKIPTEYEEMVRTKDLYKIGDRIKLHFPDEFEAVTGATITSGAANEEALLILRV